MNRFIILAIFLFAFFVGCNSVEKKISKDFANNQWVYGDSLQLEFEPKNLASSYELKLKGAFNDDFPYSNLYIKFRVIEPDGEETESLANFQLTDIQGKWVVSKSFGKYAVDFTLNPNVQFQKQGKHRFVLAQYLRDDTLKGVYNIQFQIIPK